MKKHIKFSDILEKSILEFPENKVEMLLTNEKVEITIVRIGTDKYSIRAFGIEIATKEENGPVTYKEDTLDEIEQILGNDEELGQLEIQNPESVKSYLGLEEQAILYEELARKRGTKPPHIEQQKVQDNNVKDRISFKRKKQDSLSDKKRKADRQLAEALKRQEEEQERKRQKGQERTVMNLTRENSSDEALKQFIFRTMKINAQKVVRVRTGAHTYEYEIYDQTGKNVGKDLLTPKIGGKNPRMSIWILNNEGHYEKREVDSLLLTRNGRYGFATDRGNGALGDVTTSYQVTRLPGGEYIAVQALEEQKRNREASQIEAVKNATASKNSDHEMKDKILAANEAKEIDAAQKDGVIDTKEVRIIELLRREGFKQEEIDVIFEDIYENTVKEGMSCNEVEKTVTAVRDLKEQGCSIEKIRKVLEDNVDVGDDENGGGRTPGGDALDRRDNRKQ